MPSLLEPTAAPARAESPSICFVCGQEHPTGLRIRYRPCDAGGVEARWTPGPAWQGFPGIVHGGIVSTVLDEAMSKAVAALGCKALTAELRVRFRQPVEPGREWIIRGWIVDRHRRRLRTEASVTGPDGVECAHAWATFLTVLEGEGR
jgi:acyl-coenzyme A thioesterase PaaI-like protein